MEHPKHLAFPDEGISKWQDGSPYMVIYKSPVSFSTDLIPDPRRKAEIHSPGSILSIDSSIFWFPRDGLNDPNSIEPDDYDPRSERYHRRDWTAYKDTQNQTHEVYEPEPKMNSNINESHTSVFVCEKGLPFNAAARGLCDNCSKYNWKCLLEVECALQLESYYFSYSYGLRKSNKVKLSNVEKSQASCTLCNFVFRLAKTSPKYDPDSLQDGVFDAVCSLKKLPNYLSLSFQFGPFESGERENPLKCGVLSHEVLDYYRSAWAPMADISVLKGFWNECRSSHPECHSETQQYFSSLYGDPTLRFRVIDVVTDRVILAPLNCSYVALSYVWGSNRSRGLQRDDFLGSLRDGALPSDTYVQLNRSSLPLTISDAMQFVKSMGLQYLWVDQLCIVQDDPEELLYTIKAMNKIYGASAFTIIASGKDAGSGLPGVNNNPRHLDPIIGSADKITLFHAPPDPATKGLHPLGTSTWMSRGWTYQELYFSQKQFIFAADRVYYNCRSLLKVETSPGNRFSSMKRFSQPITDSDPFKQYVAHVKDYSRRSLTYPDDVLNAFSGIMSDMSEKHGIKPYYGLPLSSGGRGLEWISRRRLQRRPTFPSWSWAGWIGPVNYPTYFHSTVCGDEYYYHIRPLDENWGAASMDGILEFHAPYNNINLEDVKNCTDADFAFGDGLSYTLNMDGDSEWTFGSQECLLVVTYPDARMGGLIIVRKSPGGIYYRIGYIECSFAAFKASFIMKTIRLG